VELEILNDGARGYSYRISSGPELTIKKGNGQPKSFDDFMQNDPVIIQYVDGSFSYNNFIVYVREQDQIYDFDNIEINDWNGTDIRKSRRVNLEVLILFSTEWSEIFIMISEFCLMMTLPEKRRI
ncbi:MAG: hypothetical protein IPQ16_03810, partial [Geobacteraceae bacterium]|nr:hypothetical protein [Geobacteraceae bacterium]